jgi:hypothetical protein
MKKIFLLLTIIFFVACSNNKSQLEQVDDNTRLEDFTYQEFETKLTEEIVDDLAPQDEIEKEINRLQNKGQHFWHLGQEKYRGDITANEVFKLDFRRKDLFDKDSNFELDSSKKPFVYKNKLGFIGTKNNETFIYFNNQKISPDIGSIRTNACCALTDYPFYIYKNGILFFLSRRGNKYFFHEINLNKYLDNFVQETKKREPIFEAICGVEQKDFKAEELKYKNLNEEQALEIAREGAYQLYGKDQIAGQEPLEAKLNQDVWLIEGTFDCPSIKLKEGEILESECVGGVVQVKVSKQDGKIIDICHGE